MCLFTYKEQWVSWELVGAASCYPAELVKVCEKK